MVLTFDIPGSSDFGGIPKISFGDLTSKARKDIKAAAAEVTGAIGKVAKAAAPVAVAGLILIARGTKIGGKGLEFVGNKSIGVALGAAAGISKVVTAGGGLLGKAVGTADAPALTDANVIDQNFITGEPLGIQMEVTDSELVLETVSIDGKPEITDNGILNLRIPKQTIGQVQAAIRLGMAKPSCQCDRPASELSEFCRMICKK